ncbi:hypothetical protein EBZ35_03310 [bacterium]|nr:hypothetical protein [bacterium]
MIIWLQGTDDARVMHRYHQLRRTLVNQPIESLPSEATCDELMMALCGRQLFDAQKVVVIMNPWWLGRSLDDGPFRELKDTLAMANPDAPLWVISTKKLDMRLKACAHLKKISQHETYSLFEEWEGGKARQWVIQHIRDTGLSVTDHAVTLLADHVGTQVSRLLPLIDTLRSLYHPPNPIDTHEVWLVLGPQAASLHTLTTAFKKGQKKELIRSLHRLMQQGEDPIKLVATLGHTTELLLSMVARKGQGVEAIATQLGRHPFFIKQTLADMGQHHDMASLTAIMHGLHGLDYDIKRGRIRSQDSLPRLIALLSH